MEGPGIESRWGEIFRAYQDRLRGPPSLLYNGYRVFPGGKGGRSVMPTTHPLLVPRLKKCWAIPQLTLWILLGLLRGYLYLYLGFIIQGVSRLEDITARGDFLGLSDQKSSYKHVSDFGRLRSYGHFLIPVHALVWTASHGTSWPGDVLNLVAYLLRCQHYFRHLTRRSSQLSGSLCCGRRWHFRKPALSTDQFKLKVISRS